MAAVHPDQDILEMIQILDETRQIVGSAVIGLFGRGERLEALSDRSEELVEQSRDFHYLTSAITGSGTRWAAGTVKALVRLLTCDYLCVDVYGMVSGEMADFTSRPREHRPPFTENDWKIQGEFPDHAPSSTRMIRESGRHCHDL
jgi:hypothetical protein